MDFQWPEELIALREEAQNFARQATAGLDVLEDSWLIGYSRETSRALGERGWLGTTWPKAIGGGGQSPLYRFVLAETLISAGVPVAASWFADRQIGPVLLGYGTAEQQHRFLPDILAGQSSWCIGMSEPDAGSDVASIRTQALPNGRDFIVNGAKVWTSFAAVADWCYLICRTNTDPTVPGHRAMSEFIVDMSTPGISVSPIRDMTGGAHFCEVTFDDVHVPASHLVGTLHGSFGQTMRQLEHERGGIDRLASNAALYRDTLKSLDNSTLANSITRQRIATIESAYRIGRLMVLREVLGQAPPSFSAATKTWCTEFEQDVASFCCEFGGAKSMLWDRVARGVCYAPAYTIMGGTTQVLRNIIAERVLGLPR